MSSNTVSVALGALQVDEKPVVVPCGDVLPEFDRLAKGGANNVDSTVVVETA